jgi:uncharacterized protein
VVNGARQCGKSTLAAEIADARGGEWRSLDRAATRQAASFDPTEFVANEDLMVIDEVQRVPELLLAIKESADNDPRPGRFLLTGSARVLSLRAVPDALPGRMETVELWPVATAKVAMADSGIASSTVRAEGFRGLRHLAARLGEDLLVGIVLYTGRQTLPFGPHFRAIPLSALWEATPPGPHQ